MTKAEIAQQLARSTGLSQVDTAAVIEGFIEAVAQALEKGDHVEIRGFGTFKVVERAPRTWPQSQSRRDHRNPQAQDPDLQTLQRRKEQNRPALTMNLLLISIDSLRLDFAPGISATVRTRPDFPL